MGSPARAKTLDAIHNEVKAQEAKLIRDRIAHEVHRQPNVMCRK